jgi:hypothetical protein
MHSLVLSFPVRFHLYFPSCLSLFHMNGHLLAVIVFNTIKEILSSVHNTYSYHCVHNFTNFSSSVSTLRSHFWYSALNRK